MESTIRFSALSAPTDSSEIGMLLSMVAGSRSSGSGRPGTARARGCRVCAASNASQPPMISSPSMCVLLQAATDRVQVLDGRHAPADAELGAAAAGPALDVAPVQLLDVAVDQPAEAAVDAEHGVPAVQAEPHRGRRPPRSSPARARRR